MALDITMPRLSDSMEEGTIVQWLVAEGDHVERGQPLAEVETDKATVVYEADAVGVILALSVSEGASVPVGAPIAVIGEAGEELPAARSPEAAAAAGAPAAGVAGPPGADPIRPSRTHSGRTKASPLARRLAAQMHVDLAAVTGSGPSGRVIRADVEMAASGGNGIPTPEPSPLIQPTQPSPLTSSAPLTPVAAGGPAPAAPAKGASTVHELTRLQKTVARRMAESRGTVPDIELRSEVDMSEAVELRERLREVADPPPSYNDFIVKAAALALREFPRVNGAYRDAAIETFSRVNVGIAVAADEALVVPTIFDADRVSLGEISQIARALAARVRDRSITPAELTGATFTVSNLGMYGVDSFSAVINPPQAAILAVGSLKRRAVVDDDGQLVARPTVVLTLACDHRIIYGADGARFLARVRELLERPHALLL